MASLVHARDMGKFQSRVHSNIFTFYNIVGVMFQSHILVRTWNAFVEDFPKHIVMKSIAYEIIEKLWWS